MEADHSMTRSSSELQRKQRLQLLIQKRKSNLKYLRNFHLGNSLWLNTCTSRSLTMHYNSIIPKSRPVLYYYLGLSIENLLCNDYESYESINIPALAQLVEEYDYFGSGSTMKALLAKNSLCVYPQEISIPRPTLFKFNNAVVYERLKTPTVPFELDYIDIVLSLCTSLIGLYERIQKEPNCYRDPILYDQTIRADARICGLFIDVLAEELTNSSCKIVETEVDYLKTLLTG